MKMTGLVRGALGVLFFAGLGLSVVNVVMRFVLLQPIQWAEEVLGHWLVWSVCIGSFLVTSERQHLCMDLVVNRMPAPVRRRLVGLASAAVAAIAVLMAVESAIVLKMMMQFGQRTMAAGIPVAIPYTGITFGFALMALAVLAGWMKRKP
jgi:TRAP-type C4-dicarboxylate transport system permease small subunit